MTLVTPAIMIGGSGTRLWPLSRHDRPKQFHALGGDASMFQQTLARFTGSAYDSPWLLTTEAMADLAQSHADEVHVRLGGFILEPAARSTGPALAAAALIMGAEDPNRLILAAPADHLMLEPDDFHRAVRAAIPVAKAGRIVTFGIRPGSPETGFGYIAVAAPIGEAEGVFAVESFVEKPPLALAEAYVASGRHYWNAGIFLFTARTLLEEMTRYAPEVAESVSLAWRRASGGNGRHLLDHAAFAAAPEVSIDNAVMERSGRIAVAPCTPAWSDVGSWAALWEASPKDASGNALVGDVVANSASGCLVHAVGNRLVAINGVENVAVIETDDVTLVTTLAGAQGVKDVVKHLASIGRQEYRRSATEAAAWGTSSRVAANASFTVKHVVINPGQCLPLCYHHHRSLHWTVVAGTVEVTLETATRFLRVGQSVHVPECAVHGLRNPGRLAAHVVAVECGTYFGDDDVVLVTERPDRFGRAIAAE
jgi:mannose-1-phosphate guanylyltransferase/mannose-6-phosphate isomerase